MAIKEQYYTVDGQMIGYKDAAGRKDFLTDALGSVTAEVDQTGATKTFDGRYKPYGGDLSSTGTRGSYGWVGTWGYRGTGLSASSHYVRARHYSKTSGNWLTEDRFWPSEMAYCYVDGRVTASIDPSGLLPSTIIGLLTGCAVYKCTFNGGFRHQFMCTEGPGLGNGCSGGIWPGWNPCEPGVKGDSGYGGNCNQFAGTEDGQYSCVLVSTSCTDASLVCAQIGLPMPGFWESGFCWGYACNNSCAGCDAYPSSSSQYKKCVCSRCHCTHGKWVKTCKDNNGNVVGCGGIVS